MKLPSKNTRKAYLLNFSLITILFSIICWVLDFTPFGEGTMLTIDMGQQYIDFFSLYKNTLTKDPQMAIYSFQKGIGGEMIGLWAYYLMSPFNLVFLIFPRDLFPLAVTLVSYLKILALSTTILYYLRNKFQLSLLQNQIFALSYAFMAYVMIYLLNIMWLDGVIMLPLIALGLERLLKSQGRKMYVVCLALALIFNYYIGYMICLFLAFYAVYAIVESLNDLGKLSIKNFFKLYGRFLLHSVVACLIACLVLIPTLMSIMGTSKGSAGFEWSLEPVHELGDIVGKLVFGSFEYEEIKSSAPNLYVGVLPLVLLVLYYFNPKIKISEKLTSVLVFLVFFLSYRYSFMDQIWHGGKFPIWYDFRFSFTNSFFIIALASKACANRPDRTSTWALASCVVAFGITSIYYLKNPLDYLEPTNILIWLIMAMLVVIVLTRNVRGVWVSGFLLCLVAVDLTGNAIYSMSEFSYVQKSRFDDYTKLLAQASEGLKPESDEFYRIDKTYSRTRNESMYVGIYGLDHFGSTIEKSTTDLFGYLGLPNTSGTASYRHPTLFTDDLFSVRYILEPTPDSDAHTPEGGYGLSSSASDFDNDFYPLVQIRDRYQVRENVNRFGLGIEVKPEIADDQCQFTQHRPIENQELLLGLIDYSGNGSNYFDKVPIDSIRYHKINISDKGEYGDYYTYENLSQNTDDDKAYFELDFTTDQDKLYYFTLPSQYNSDNVDLSLNGYDYKFYSNYNDRQVTNASYLTSGTQTLRVTLKEDQMQANQIELYTFDYSRYDQMVRSKMDSRFTVTDFSQTNIKGKIQTHQEQGYLLFSIPYDKNWRVTIDGESVEPIPVLSDTLMAVPIRKGHHQVELTYRSNSLIIGGIVCLIGLVALFILDRKPFGDLQ